MPHLDSESFSLLVIDNESNKPLSEKGWFIKFYAPWCGHCTKLAPTWTELYEKHSETLNVAKVDCTQPQSKNLCSRLEVRGYPTLGYLPAQSESEEFAGHIIKYRGVRDLPSLEEWLFKDGYSVAAKSGVEGSEPVKIPPFEEGLENKEVPPQRMIYDIQRVIDRLFKRYGLADVVPPVARYLIVLTLCSLPFILYFYCLCKYYVSDEDYQAAS